MPAFAGTDFTDLTEGERAVFHAEIRAALQDLPELLPRDVSSLRLEVAGDLARIEANAADLFAPDKRHPESTAGAPRVALFVSQDCGDPCAEALNDLLSLAQTQGIRLYVHDLSQGDLAQRMQIDTAPFYVFRDRLFRGHMPPVVLERYLAP